MYSRHLLDTINMTPIPPVSATLALAHDLPQPCPLVGFVHLVSGKWAIPILYRLIITGQPIRFRELQRLAQPITQKELTKQLRLLEKRGLVHRTQYDEMPLRVEYRASEAAMGLIDGLEAIAGWMRSQGQSLLAGDQADQRA